MEYILYTLIPIYLTGMSRVHFINICLPYQSLVGSVVIGVELGREDHGSIPRNCDQEGDGTT
jgi:hypothetical protein